jgi:hypothetical protein
LTHPSRADLAHHRSSFKISHIYVHHLYLFKSPRTRHLVLPGPFLLFSSSLTTLPNSSINLDKQSSRPIRQLQ